MSAPADPAATVRASLDTTRQALGRFATSLRAAGFPTAGPQYLRLQSVLLHQRAWTAENRHADLDPVWREIASEAKAIHDMLQPILQSMLVIKSLETPPTSIDVAPPEAAPAAEAATPPAAPPEKPRRAAGKKAGAKKAAAARSPPKPRKPKGG